MERRAAGAALPLVRAISPTTGQSCPGVKRQPPIRLSDGAGAGRDGARAVPPPPSPTVTRAVGSRFHRPDAARGPAVPPDAATRAALRRRRSGGGAHSPAGVQPSTPVVSVAHAFASSAVATATIGV